MNYGSSLWVPVILQEKLIVIRSLLCFLLAVCLVPRVISGIIFQNNAASFILYISSLLYEPTISQISCNYFSTTTKLTAPAFPYYRYFLILCLALKPFNHPVENLGISGAAYYGNFPNNIVAIFFKILPITIDFFYTIFYYYSNNISFKSIYYAYHYFFIPSRLDLVFK